MTVMVEDDKGDMTIMMVTEVVMVAYIIHTVLCRKHS